MARPRIIKLEHGEVSLQGFPKEIADALSEHINNFGRTALVDKTLVEEIQQTNKNLEEGLKLLEPSLEELTSRAIGVHVDGKQHSLVTVAYDVNTKNAKVEHVLKCFDARECRMEFKKAADRNKFV
jgi:hypothetical protein